MKNIFKTSLLFATLVLLTLGCKETKTAQEKPSTSRCDTNASTIVNAATLHVMQNTLTNTTKILGDINNTLQNMDRMNTAVLNTVQVSADTLKILAAPFIISSEGANIFEVNNSLPGFSIKQPLSKKYILVSSTSRFFPDTNSIKTLFFNPSSLSSALQRALTNADKSKNLYLTILQVETNARITNLTNGLLIKSSQLH